MIDPSSKPDTFAHPGICDLEIGYAARNADEWDQLTSALDAF